jgi:hypothetical protein
MLPYSLVLLLLFLLLLMLLMLLLSLLLFFGADVAADVVVVAVVVADALVLLPGPLQSLLLRSASGWGEFQDLLGLTPLNNSQLMVKLLLPQLTLLPQPYPDTLLALLLGGWGRYKGSAELVEVLVEIPFVPARGEEQQQQGLGGGVEGCLKGCYRPKELFDPQQPLFDRVFPALMAAAGPSGFSSSSSSSVTGGLTATAAVVNRDDRSTTTTTAAGGGGGGVVGLPHPRFPAAPYDSPAWLSLLRDVGLISQVTPEVFLTLVQLVAKWAAETAAAAGASGCSSRSAVAGRLSQLLPPGVVDLGRCDSSSLGEIDRVCVVLLEHLKSHYHGWGLVDRGWWEALGGVPWVTATFGVPGTGEGRGGEGVIFCSTP